MKVRTDKTATLLLDSYALDALTILEASGHEAWIVGGAVRDALINQLSSPAIPTANNQTLSSHQRNAHTNLADPSTIFSNTHVSTPSFTAQSTVKLPSDIDIACSATPQQTAETFLKHGWKINETGLKHGTITAYLPNTCSFEVTMFRTEGAYSDNRHPDCVAQAHTIEEDLQRRDFTMNAIAWHPVRGLCDPFNGVSDIQNALIRCVGDPRMRFREDALRILRAIRFFSQLGFALEEQTLYMMKTQKRYLLDISPERIYAELEGILMGQQAASALMSCIDALAPVLPELAACKGFQQNSPYHIYDVLEHTAHCVSYMPFEPTQRWAALFHDIGKPPSYFEDEEGGGHFYGHAKLSEKIAHTAMMRLKFPTKMRRTIEILVGHHDDHIENTPRAIKRAVQRLNNEMPGQKSTEETSQLFHMLCALKKADSLSHAPWCINNRLLAIQEIECAFENIIKQNDAFTLRDLAIGGSELISLGVPAGPERGRLLNECLNAVVDERVENTPEALQAYLRCALSEAQK